mmetsp:Transcript_143595/g.459323  ORF Transcript_143595/g.459323 Transcript_143595/m.459323 type:complete len:237 (-) Transcript_143595:1756-2466(-)
MSDEGASFAVHEAHDPIRGHDQGPEHRHHHSRGQRAGLRHVVDGIGGQGHEQGRGHGREAADNHEGCGDVAHDQPRQLSAQVLPDYIRRFAHNVQQRQLMHLPIAGYPLWRTRARCQPAWCSLVRQRRRGRHGEASARRAQLRLEALAAALQVVVVWKDREDLTGIPQLLRVARIEPRAHLFSLLLGQAQASPPVLAACQAGLVGARADVLMHEALLQQLVHPVPPHPVVVAHRDL